MAGEQRIEIETSADIVTARQKGREIAATVGFSSTDLTVIATAISELARNIVLYASRGTILLDAVVDGGGRRGIIVTASDRGPGIADVQQAMRCGYSTSGSLGLGLPGVKRLMDEMHIESVVGKGTSVTAKKWKR